MLRRAAAATPLGCRGVGCGNRGGWAHYPHEMKIEYPPRDRSKAWSLPVHKKMVFLSNGWSA